MKTFKIALAVTTLAVLAGLSTVSPVNAADPTAVLTVPTSTGDPKVFKAKFTPATNGATVRLQAQEICTYETDETDPVSGSIDDPENEDQANCEGPWTTRATSTQNSTGNTTLTMPVALEVKHNYRVVSGSTTSPEVSFAPTPKTNPYGIDTGLSELHFNTYEDDTVDSKTRYFEGEFSMTGSDKSIDVDGNGPKPSAKCSAVQPMMKSALKGRGNWSWTFPKKSFSLKTADKTDLCGMGSNKKWALVANDFDKSLLRNTVASYMGQKFSNMGWTPKAVPVEFYMNGSYRGSYLLIERIAIADNRLNIKELNGDDATEQTAPKITGGYVLEWDYRKGADYNVLLPYGSDSYIGVKEPENDRNREGELTDKGISTAQKQYISKYLNDADDAIRGSNFEDPTTGWRKYIDEASAVDYYIAMEFMKPFDGNMWASVYMYKPRAATGESESKIHFGPMWDFDLSAGSFTRSVPNLLNTSGWYLKTNQNTDDQQPLSGKSWFNRLNDDPAFKLAVAKRWNAVQGSVNVGGLIDQQKTLLSQSVTANFKKWPYSSRVSPNQLIKGSWSSDVSYLRSWVVARKAYMDSVCATGSAC